MKKILLIIFAILMSVSVNAQCPLSKAVDFTAIDHDGNEVNLFEILDAGQYVLINFFCATSEHSKKIEPNLVEAYKLMGSNKQDVFFMDISSIDSDYSVGQWVSSYGIEYPVISSTNAGVHGGDDIYGMYEIPYFPMIILIAPDREIVIKDLWSVSSAQTIVDALVAVGIEQPAIPKDTDYRNVLIEEFTGRECGNCPDGHRIANQIAAANPGKVFPINIHAGGFSPTNYPNLNTEDGLAILYGFNVPGYPMGNVNRISNDAIDRELWYSQSKKQMEQLAEVLIDGQVELDKESRIAEIKVDLSYVLENVSTTNYLTVMMLQDYIWGEQSGGELNPDQYDADDEQYCHMHVLRDVVTPTWGDEISNITTGSQITKTYTYEIPKVIGSPNGVEVDLNNIYFLAVVTEKYQGVPTCPVLNVNKLRTIADSDVLSSPTNVTATPASASSITIDWSEVGSALSYNVYRDGSLIANVSTLSYTDKDLNPDTEYCYMVTSCRDGVESGYSKQACVKTLADGVGEYEFNINIYPNPVKDELYVEAAAAVEEVTIYNVVGAVAERWMTDNTQSTLRIDVSDLQSGVYFVKIRTSDNEIVNRIVKH